MTEPTPTYTPPNTTALAIAAIVLRGELRGLAHAAALRISAATGRTVNERSVAESLVSAFNAWAKDALEIRQEAQP